jgi:hypothetical protein
MAGAGVLSFFYSHSIAKRLLEDIMQVSRFPLRRVLLLGAVAAACAAPIFAAQAEPPTEGIRTVRAKHSSEGGEPYALVRADSHLNMTTYKVDNADIAAIRRGVQGEFFWFRKDGKEFIVQDPSLLARVRQAWAPMEKTGAEMEQHGKEMGRHGEAMGKYGNQMALAAVTLNKTKMEAIGKQMEEAGKPMEALGKKMEALGEQMEAQQKDADRTTRTIIGEALAGGKAQPAPRRG